MRFVLPVLLALLLAGLFWAFLAGQEAGSSRGVGDGADAPDGAPELTAAGRKDALRKDASEAGASDEWVPPPVPAGHGPVTITVLDWEGKPLPGALVELRPQGHGFTSLQTDAEGKAAFPSLSLKKRCELVVHTWPFRESRSHRDPDWMPRDTTVTLERALKITGQVVDETGAPASDFRVSYTLPGSDQVDNVLLLENGSFEIGDLGPGAVRVWATYKEHKPRYLQGDPPFAAGPEEVEAGTRGLVLRVERRGVLHVQVENALIDERLGPLKGTLHALESGKRYQAEVDLDGHVVFLGLDPGEAHRLTIYGLGRGQYVDVSDLRPRKKVQLLQSRDGRRIEGLFTVPDGLRVLSGSIHATNEALGAAAGFVDVRGLRFRVDGLPPEAAWRVVLRAVASRDGERVDLEAEASTRPGEEAQLTLRETATRPR